MFDHFEHHHAVEVRGGGGSRRKRSENLASHQIQGALAHRWRQFDTEDLPPARVCFTQEITCRASDFEHGARLFYLPQAVEARRHEAACIPPRLFIIGITVAATT